MLLETAFPMMTPGLEANAPRPPAPVAMWASHSPALACMIECCACHRANIGCRDMSWHEVYASGYLNLSDELASLPVHQSQVPFAPCKRQIATAAGEVQRVGPKFCEAQIEHLPGCSNLCCLHNFILYHKDVLVIVMDFDACAEAAGMTCNCLKHEQGIAEAQLPLKAGPTLYL